MLSSLRRAEVEEHPALDHNQNHSMIEKGELNVR